MAWTEERTTKLRELIAKGWAYSAIANELGGVSRNGCIGKAYRLGIYGASERKPRATPKAAQWRKPSKPQPLSEVPPLPQSPTLRFTEAIEEVALGNIALLDLKPHHCRWPFGDGPIVFCGATKQDGSSYCAEHRRFGTA